MKTRFLISFVLLCAIIISLNQCKKEDTVQPTASDKDLFNKAQSSALIYFKGDSSYLPTTPASGHYSSFFRVRFNAIALAALTDTGELPVNGVFPEGSLVVKELYNAQKELKLIAVMEKATGNSLTANNWIWGEYFPGGNLGITVTEKGAQCTNCHSATGHRDYVRTFEFY